MHNLKAKFDKILELITPFAQKMVNEHGNIPRRGVVPKFSDLSVVALALASEASSINSENYLFHLLSACKDDFPNLISRCQFNQRRKYLAELLNVIRYNVVQTVDADEDLFLVDSKPAPVCRNVRAGRVKIGKYDTEFHPDFGYCATQQQYYYGYKLHVTSSLRGIIHTFTLSPASVADIRYLQEVKFELPDSTIIADKAYLSAEVQLDLFQSANIRLEVPLRHNQKGYQPLYKPFSKARRRIETTFSQLNDQFTMLQNYAKSSRGFFARLLAKISAFTLLQLLNYARGDTLCATKYTLI